MNNLKYFFCIIISLFYFNTFSQVIKGTISSEGEPILNASVLFKEKSDKQNIKEFAIVRNGSFQKELKVNYDTLHIELKAEGYYNQIKSVVKPIKDEVYSFAFDLIKMQDYELEEVIIIGKERAFEIKEDTIAYTVSRYIDGSERKIEEVISKLPGVEVNDQTGEIKYKGKSIETVTLDGDNLFGFNYSLGTKNINVDMVEQIEAIDNYSENPLLKGIEQGGKVSLNLVLKKGKIDFSGNLDAGNGWFTDNNLANNFGANLLGITKAYKSFATLSYNNIGVNHTPFDYFSFSLNTEQLKENDYFAKKVIPEAQFSNVLDNSRANINNQFFGNYNAIFKINPKLSLKTNLYYLRDRITANQLLQNDYLISNENFTTTDHTTITKKPQQYRGDLEIKYNTSTTSLLEYNIRLREENIKTPTQNILNDVDVFSSHLDTKDFYLKQDLLWTKKLSNHEALQISLFHSLNNAPQQLSITPSVFNDSESNDIQESKFRKTILENKATYLGSGQRDRYSFTIAANFNDTPFSSRLYNSDEILSENAFDYSQNTFFTTGSYNFNRGKWQISPSYSIRFLKQKVNYILEDITNIEDDFIFDPNLNIRYKLNFNSFLSANFGYNQNTSTEEYFFLNQILINSRTTISNLPSLELKKGQAYNVLYFINDLYNQFQFNANLNLLKSTGNFFANQSITENTTQIEYFYSPQNNTNWNANMQVSKYIPFLASTLKLTSNYSTSKFKNIVNNSDLRQNKNHFISNSFFWKTAFDMPVNFDNTITYQYSTAKSEESAAFTNKSWQNTFNLITRFNQKWFFIVSSDYYLPNTKQSKQDFMFLDATFRHTPNSKKWEANLSLRNLTNEKNFEQVQTSDIATSIYRNNLLPRYFLLNFTWNF